MMPNITMTQWESTQAVLAAEVARRWPWLHKPYTSERIRVECPAMSAAVYLRSAEREGALRVRVSVVSSGGCGDGPAEVAEFVRQVSEVRDAMLFLHGRTLGLTIWRNGECPCSLCNGNGKSRGQMCSTCAGTGKV